MVNLAVIKVFILATISFIIALFSTPLLTHFLYKYKLGKQIRDENSQAPIYAKLHQHKKGTPTMGGIIIWLTVLIMAVFFFYISRLFSGTILANFNFLTRAETLLPLGALIASALVGLIDDWLGVKGIGPNSGGLTMKHRLLIYTFIAVVGALWFYYKLDWDLLHVPFVGNFEVGLWYLPIFVFILVATSHAVNLTDGLDGLAGGTLLTAFATVGTFSFIQGKYDLTTFCGVIVGALTAFLWFNINPARFIMGDTGAMSLGVTLGIVALLTNTALFLPIIGIIFVIETLSVIIQLISKRLRQGKKIFISTPLHHHFEAAGWPEPKIVMRFWLISGIASVIGIVLFLLDKILY